MLKLAHDSAGEQLDVLKDPFLVPNFTLMDSYENGAKKGRRRRESCRPGPLILPIDTMQWMNLQRVYAALAGER